MYDTTNTRLAAALNALGFTLVSWDDAGEAQTMFHFDDNVLFGKNAAQYNYLWREKEWHQWNPNHPFCYIVKAAEARDWIINRVIHGQYQETGGEDQSNYFVYDLNIATCIIAGGYYLLRFTDRRFYFVGDAQSLHKAYAKPEHDTELWWQHLYLRKLKLLMALVPRAKNKLDNLYVSG